METRRGREGQPEGHDTSFLVAVYSPEAGSMEALAYMQHLRKPLPFTPFHRHELRTGLRLRVFRKEITVEQRKEAFREVASDLENSIVKKRDFLRKNGRGGEI